MTAIYSNGSNRWNILGFNFTKRDALSSVYIRYLWGEHLGDKYINYHLPPHILAIICFPYTIPDGRIDIILRLKLLTFL